MTLVSLQVALVFVLCVVCVMWFCVGSAFGVPSSHQFEIVPGSFSFTPSSYQAGAHADWTFAFDFAHEADGETYNDVRTIVNEFPAGFDASNTAVPTCTEAQLLAKNPSVPGNVPDCPIASQIGDVSTEIFVNPENPRPYQVTFPAYNIEVSSFGTAAEVGYNAVGLFTQISQAVIRPQDEGITAVTRNIPKVGEAHNIAVTLWGLPAAHEHDALRGALCGDEGEIPPVCHNEFGSPQEARIPVRPFLSNPTSCGMFKAAMEAESWEEAGRSKSTAEAEVGPIVECGRVPFEPSIEVQPSTRDAESPSGLEVSLVVPQTWENQFAVSTANLKDTTVALPEGMTANPSLAAGLGACTPEQYASETSASLPGEGCPPESKIGSIEIETPLLAEKILGSVYIAQPYNNVPEFGSAAHPDGSLLALYVVAKDPARGILVKVAGRIEPNPVTGQLVTTFSDTPQQPFSKFKLKFRPGATAPLVSPPLCGFYNTVGALTPWSTMPEEPLLQTVSSAFEITQGINEGPCPTGGVPPFKPQVVSGTDNSSAGAYSPFYLRIIRMDGEQEITKFSTTLPPGLSGNLSNIALCEGPEIQAARTATGVEELQHPSCPASSEIGHTIVSAGVGPVLAQTPGKVYLAGEYNGAPLSIVSVTSATVGPFDLGTVVIRFGLQINPNSAQVEVSSTGSDPIPRIIDGIVVHVREIRVYMDREKFTLNPTNCAPLSITNTITGADTGLAGQSPLSIATPFQAADCAGLMFKPGFKVSTSGKTSRRMGASLTAKVTFPTSPAGSESNIAKVKVDLPKQLPSRLTTLQKACTAAQFNTNPTGCPPESIVGKAKAITPILPVPLEGPAYFVSHGGERFPSLIVVLKGYGLTIDLVGTTFISKKGITSSTFETVPDQPVTTFELTLPEGKYSALAANGNLCKTKLTMPTAFIGQNGAEIHETTKINVTNCPKQKKTTKTKKHGGGGKKTKKKK